MSGRRKRRSSSLSARSSSRSKTRRRRRSPVDVQEEERRVHRERNQDRTRHHRRRYESRSPLTDSAASSTSSRERRSSRHTKKKLGEKEIKKLRDAIIEEKFGYRNESNPFNDKQLTAPFVWIKKEKLLKAAGQPSERSFGGEEYLERTRRKIREIESVKKRREEREEEERLLEEQQTYLARERELEHYAEWEEKEESFHRAMTQRRVNIRVKESRARTSDLLFKALQIIDGVRFEDLTLTNILPHLLFSKLPKEEAQQLLEDVKSHCEIAALARPEEESSTPSWARNLDSGLMELREPSRVSAQQLERHEKFWQAMKLIGTDVLSDNPRYTRGEATSQARRTTGTGPPIPRDVHTGIAIPALEEMKAMLSKKSEAELSKLEPDVESKLRNIRRDLTSREDPTYWETILDVLPYYKAVAICRQVHEDATSAAQQASPSKQKTFSLPRSNAEFPEDHETSLSEEAEKPLPEYAPPLFPVCSFPNATLISLTAFNKERNLLRQSLMDKRKALLAQMSLHSPKEAEKESVPDEPGRELYEKFVQQEQQSMQEDEFAMTPAYEVPLPHTAVGSNKDDRTAKYRPRKPRFFNRVKTGYEWSKYNQTHYDRDNPPPKAVQGYKFNLFYPDLVEITKAPTWKLTPSENTETVLLQFQSGPPYEDMRFRIINREWDLHPRSGFKNTFDRGILQLHFNFKRYRYRR